MYIIPLKQGIRLLTIGFLSEGLYTVSRKFTENICWKRTSYQTKKMLIQMMQLALLCIRRLSLARKHNELFRNNKRIENHSCLNCDRVTRIQRAEGSKNILKMFVTTQKKKHIQSMAHCSCADQCP